MTVSLQSNKYCLLYYYIFIKARGALSPNWSYRGTTPPRTSLSPQKNQGHQMHNASWNNSSMMNQSLNQSTLSGNISFQSPYAMKFTQDDVITDERSLHQYLK